MVQESQDNPNLEVPIDGDIAVEWIQDPEVIAANDSVASNVFMTVKQPWFLGKILWHLNTEQAWETVNELMKKREVLNDNAKQIEKEKAA